jgi:predicted nuclease of predicted toxin-antitoxin system
MRFLADENFPGAAVAALRVTGHDVVWVRTETPGQGDREILSWATRDDRILLTFDKDFGELVANSPKAVSGLILFRVPTTRPDEVGRRLADLIATRDDWAGHFSVIEPGRIRMRRLNAMDG